MSSTVARSEWKGKGSAELLGVSLLERISATGYCTFFKADSDPIWAGLCAFSRGPYPPRSKALSHRLEEGGGDQGLLVEKAEHAGDDTTYLTPQGRKRCLSIQAEKRSGLFVSLFIRINGGWSILIGGLVRERPQAILGRLRRTGGVLTYRGTPAAS